MDLLPRGRCVRTRTSAPPPTAESARQDSNLVSVIMRETDVPSQYRLSLCKNNTGNRARHMFIVLCKNNQPEPNFYLILIPNEVILFTMKKRITQAHIYCASTIFGLVSLYIHVIYFSSDLHCWQCGVDEE